MDKASLTLKELLSPACDSSMVHMVPGVSRTQLEESHVNFDRKLCLQRVRMIRESLSRADTGSHGRVLISF